MLIPTVIDHRLALAAARSGVPAYGPYGVAPPPREHAGSWTITRAFMPVVLGTYSAATLLVHHPTLPGLAWELGAITAWCGPELDLATTASVLVKRAIPRLPLDAEPEPVFELLFHLDPVNGPPSPALLSRLARWLTPQGRMCLAFQADLARPLSVPEDVRLVVADETCLPGRPAFDPASWERAVALAARPLGHAIAAVAAERR